MTGGYATILASREPQRLFAERGNPVSIPGDSIPEPRARLRRAAQPANAALTTYTRPRGACKITIVGEVSGITDLIVAIFDGKSGARLAFQELEGNKMPRVLTFASLPSGKHQVRLTRSLECARLSYIDRSELSIVAGPVAQVTLSATTRSLRVQLVHIEPSRLGDLRPSITNLPVLIFRTDDPSWRYRTPFSLAAKETTVRTDPNGWVEFKDLGPGTYRLETPGFDPLARERGRLTFPLGKFEQDKPILGRAR